MKIRKIHIILFCLFFGTAKTAGANSQGTVADFSFECKDCDQNKIADMDLPCLLKIHSEECKKVDEEERAVCGPEDDYHLSNSGAVSWNCFIKALQSFSFVKDFFLYAIEYPFSMFSELESKIQSSVRNYIALEFFKLYRLAKSSSVEEALEVAFTMGGKSLSNMWNDAFKFLVEEYSLGCYKTEVKAEIVCSFLLSLAVDIPAGSVAGVAKLGIKGSKGLQKAQKLFKSRRAQAAFKQSVVDFTTALERRVLQSATSLKSATRRELNSFFKNMNRDQFAKQLQEHLSNMKPVSRSGTRLSQKDYNNWIKGAFVTVLTARAISSGLSRDAFSTLTGEVTDTMITAYINQQTIDPAFTNSDQ